MARFVIPFIKQLIRRKKVLLLTFLTTFLLWQVFLSRKVISKLLPHDYVFNDSIRYCNSPHKVSGNENNIVSGYTLRQVQMLVRHGDRAPIQLNALPNTSPVYISCIFNKTIPEYRKELNRYRDVARRDVFSTSGSKFNQFTSERLYCNGGQLTPYGFLQHLYLGQHLKLNYENFLMDVDLFNDVWVQSTDVPRTIQSAAALFTGVFGERLNSIPAGGQIKINVFRDTMEDAHFMLNHQLKRVDCPSFEQKLISYRSDRKTLEFYPKLKLLSLKFAEVLSIDEKFIPPINRISDVLYTKLCHGQGVPYGPHVQIPNQMVSQTFENAHLYFTSSYSFAAEFQVLSLFSQIAQRWHQLVSHRGYKHSQKIVIYSGHDSMITPVLVLLGFNDKKWPPYASRIVFEFYEKDKSDVTDNEMYFRVLFNGVAIKNIKFCKKSYVNDELCPVKDLYDYISDNLFNEVNSPDSLLYNRILNICKT